LLGLVGIVTMLLARPLARWYTALWAGIMSRPDRSADYGLEGLQTFWMFAIGFLMFYFTFLLALTKLEQ